MPACYLHRFRPEIIACSVLLRLLIWNRARKARDGANRIIDLKGQKIGHVLLFCNADIPLLCQVGDQFLLFSCVVRQKDEADKGIVI